MPDPSHRAHRAKEALEEEERQIDELTRTLEALRTKADPPASPHELEGAERRLDSAVHHLNHLREHARKSGLARHDEFEIL